MRHRLGSLGAVQLSVVEEPGTCPICAGPMRAQKTVHRQGRTLEHGAFEARETVYVCRNGCNWPSGRQVIQRASSIGGRLLPRSTVGYDVMTFIGVERFVHFRQREEILETLRERHGLTLSTGEISRLGRLFLDYLERLHLARTEGLRGALEADGGWPLHIDATGEDGRGTLLVALAGWRGWVLGAWKIPTENADAILPHLSEVATRFGAPCAIMRDLGRAMDSAAMGLVEEHHLDIPILACHAHFLKDIGKDLLEPAHAQLRAIFRQIKVRPNLRSLARDLGKKLGDGIEQARVALVDWQQSEDQGHLVPDGSAGLATVRAMAQWVLDYPADGADQGFPFDRPYLDLYNRCVLASRAVDAFLTKPPHDGGVLKALRNLRSVLQPAACGHTLAQAAKTLVRRAALFDELRSVLRLQPKPVVGIASSAAKDPNKAAAELQDIRQAVEDLTRSLRERRPKRGPAQDTRQAIDLILQHLEVHGDHLWGHDIKMPAKLGGGIRLVARTNNILEGFFHGIKHGERRRSGRKVLTKDFEDLPAAAALARNLDHQDYVALLCGTIENLPSAFACLDATQRQGALQDERPGVPATPSALAPESASLSHADRRLVRTQGMQMKLISAASSLADRFHKALKPGLAAAV